jgi:tetratricopeptide (TPR) repeat protein
MADGQYSACRKTLEGTTILPSEGARYGRVTYQQACLMEGIEHYRKGRFNAALQSIQYARQWPENLGVGKPYNVDERIENYFESQCLIGKGDKQQSEQLFQKVIEYTEESSRSHSSLDYLYLMSLKATGRAEAANDFLEAWKTSDPDDAVMKWCRAMIEGNAVEAQSVASQINTAAAGTPWDPRAADPEFEIIKALADVGSK